MDPTPEIAGNALLVPCLLCASRNTYEIPSETGPHSPEHHVKL